MTMLRGMAPVTIKPKACRPQCRSVKDGDEAFYAWGDAKRAGELEALLRGNADAMSEGGRRAPGVYSNPVLARILHCDQWRLAIALAVDSEVSLWRRNPTQRLWAQIAESIYAAPGHVTNANAAFRLGVSERTVERCLTSMRRLILITARCSFVSAP